MNIDGIIHQGCKFTINNCDLSATIGKMEAIIMTTQVTVFMRVWDHLHAQHGDIFTVLGKDAQSGRMIYLHALHPGILTVVYKNTGMIPDTVTQNQDISYFRPLFAKGFMNS